MIKQFWDWDKGREFNFSGAFELYSPNERILYEEETNTLSKPAVNKKTIYIKEVIYRNPAVVAIWSDGTKTVARCHENDKFSAEAGLMTCILKKTIGNNKFRQLFQDWLPENKIFLPNCENRVTVKDVRKKNKKNS